MIEVCVFRISDSVVNEVRMMFKKLSIINNEFKVINSKYTVFHILVNDDKDKENSINCAKIVVYGLMTEYHGDINVLDSVWR